MTKRERAYQLGDEGEKAVRTLLQLRGWDVQPGKANGVDLVVENFVTVEVKTARPSKRTDKKATRWQFCLWRDAPGRKPLEENILILRCLSEPPCHFIIPGWLIPEGQKRLDIGAINPHTYKGKYSLFREAWGLCDCLIAGFLWLRDYQI